MSGIAEKRRKRHHCQNITTVRIRDLPACIFELVAGYLPKTTKVLFAAAMQGNFDHVPIREERVKLVKNQKTITKCILESKTPSVRKLLETLEHEYASVDESESSLIPKTVRDQIEYYYKAPNWKVLDFIDLGKTVASKLSDIDLLRILNCTGANERLERINLTYCYSIVGWGLAPLKTSSTLEKMDLGLVPQGISPRDLDEECSLEEDSVLPIIDAIMDMDGTRGSSLKRFQFPLKWGSGETRRSRLKCFPCTPGHKLGRFVDNHKDTIALSLGSFCCHIRPVGCDAPSHMGSLWEGLKSDVTDRCFGFVGPGSDSDSEDPDPRWVCCQHCHTIFCDMGEEYCECGSEEYVYQCDECRQVSCKPCSRKRLKHSLNAVRQGCDSGGYSADDYKCGVEHCDRCRLELCQTGKLDCPLCKGICFDLMQRSMRAQELPWFDELCTTVEGHLMRGNREGFEYLKCYEESEDEGF